MSFFVCPFSCVFAASTAICLHKLARFGMKFSLLYLETHANTSHTTKPTCFIFIIMFIEYKQNDPLWAHLFATSHVHVFLITLSRVVLGTFISSAIRCLLLAGFRSTALIMSIFFLRETAFLLHFAIFLGTGSDVPETKRKYFYFRFLYPAFGRYGCLLAVSL